MNKLRLSDLKNTIDNNPVFQGIPPLRRLLGNYWWATALVSAVVVGTKISAATKNASAESQAKPAYSLQIIAYGEGAPKSTKSTPQDLQKNRRVDVSLKGVRVAIPESVEVPVPTALPQIAGSIWLTQDPLSIDRKLEITAPRTVEVQSGGLKEPVRFALSTNYARFLDRWEVLFYHAADSDLSQPVVSLQGSQFSNNEIVEWNGINNDDSVISVGDEYIYVLRVYDGDGNIDQTAPATLSAIGAQWQTTAGERLTKTAAETINYPSVLERQEIPVQGSRVRIYGRDLGDEVRTVTINGDPVTLDINQEFAAEYLLHSGSHEFNVALTESNGRTSIRKLTANVQDKYMFLVALADITVGQAQLRGISALDAQDNEQFNGDIFVDGRLAFFLKGKIKGKYLLTAQLDTGREDIDELFNGLSRKDSTSVFRRLDPEQYYPVYGDDSTLIDDTDSQGKLYVRLDWDQSRALWGNFNSGVTGTELGQFNRSLYGAQLKYRSSRFTRNGDHKTEANVFVSDAQSVARRIEFKGTGGSLYYLRDKDIVKGSEKLVVEVRQRESGRVVERIVLSDGKDYQIDDIQGRIILHKPLRTVGDEAAPSIIKDTPLDGNELWLIADYEYVPDEFSSGDLTAGVRGKHWLHDNLAIGGTWITEQRDGEDHELKGVDATLLSGSGSWLRAEFAQTSAAQSVGRFISENGGLNFSPFESNTTLQDLEGQAYSVEAKVDMDREFGLPINASLGAWAKFRDSGFSSAGFDTGVETTDTGLEGSAELNDKLALTARVAEINKKTASKRQYASIQADYTFSERLQLAAELRHEKQSDDIAATTGLGSLAAVQVGLDLNQWWNLYGAVQATLNNSGSYEPNDLFTVGIRSHGNSKLNLEAEASSGDRGDSLLVGGSYRVSDNYDLYINQTLSTDRTDGRRNATTVGHRRNYTPKLRLYSEHQFTDDDIQAGLGHTFGLQFDTTEHIRFDTSLQLAKLEDDNGVSTDRDVLSLGVGYKRDRTHASTRLEFRRDASELEQNEQWLTANSMNFQSSPSLRWQGKLNLSQTNDQIGNATDSKFAEVGFGFAFRPVTNDRLNVLGRITHQYDLPPLSQSAAVDEKSMVASVDMAYQVNRLWEVGGKLAFKEAQVRSERESGQWLDNDAALMASRLRFHSLFKWDAMAEYHWLQSDASNDKNHGVLVSVGKHVGDHLKLAVGYNFTAFDDNLLDQNDDAKGWFVNLVGKY